MDRRDFVQQVVTLALGVVGVAELDELRGRIRCLITWLP